MAVTESRNITNIQYRFYAIALIIILVWIMIIAQGFIVPLAWGFFFAVFMMPMVEWLERKRWNRSLAIIVSLLVFTSVVVGVLVILSAQVISIGNNLPELSTKFVDFFERTQRTLSEAFGLSAGSVNIREMLGGQTESLFSWFVGNITSVGQSFFEILLLPIYIYFILLYRDLPSRFIEARYNDENQDTIRKVFKKVQQVVRGYIIGLGLFTAITAAMDWVIFLILGIEYALFFAILVAILNLIPYIGNLIAMIIVAGYALVTQDSLWTPVLIVILISIANMIQENVVRPWVVGSSTDINAFAVFLSFIVGALIWGVSGMILFIPFVGVAKIVLEEVPNLRPYAIFLKEWNFKEKDRPQQDEQI